MTSPPTGNEAERLEALCGYGVLDTLPEQAYDDIAGLAALLCNTPIALVSLVDDRRQWFKARFGLTAQETPRELAFCAHTIRQGDLLLVPDAAADPRFAANPLVTGDPRIRFYAGAPLTTPDGYHLGTLCVIDRSPRSLTLLQREALRALARQVMAQLELRRQVNALEQARAELKESKLRLRDAAERCCQAGRPEADGRLARGLAHDFNNLLTVIAGYGRVILDEAPAPHPARAPAEQILRAADRAEELTRRLLEFARRPAAPDEPAPGPEEVPGRAIREDIPMQISPPDAGPVEEVADRWSPCHETVLLVEDEESVRQLAVHLLRRGGYTVVEAASGPDALEAAGQAGHIDLLLTDVMMPGMSGPELAERMRADSPELPVLFMSGRPDVLISDEKARAAAKHFLAKPFSIDAFTRKVREVLDAGR